MRAGIGHHSTLFFDASVLVAGSHSPTGGSALVLEACRLEGFAAQVTGAVVSESLGALKRLPELSLAFFYRLLAKVRWQFVPMPPGPILERYRLFVDAGDVHVLAAAAEAGSDYLLTLDRRHLLAAREHVAGSAIRTLILTPGEFIAGYYHLHEVLSSLPRPRRDR